MDVLSRACAERTSWRAGAGDSQRRIKRSKPTRSAFAESRTNRLQHELHEPCGGELFCVRRSSNHGTTLSAKRLGAGGRQWPRVALAREIPPVFAEGRSGLFHLEPLASANSDAFATFDVRPGQHGIWVEVLLAGRRRRRRRFRRLRRRKLAWARLGKRDIRLRIRADGRKSYDRQRSHESERCILAQNRRRS